MKIKKMLVVFTMLMCATFGFNTFGVGINSKVDIYIWAIPGPVRANVSAFENWSTNLVQQFYANGMKPAGALGYRLLPEHIIQSSSLTNNTLWFVIRVVAKDPDYRFLPSKLSFRGNSSDSLNYLATTASLSFDTNYTYTPRFYGIIWGSGGPRVNDTILSTSSSGKISEVPVNEVIFIGAQLNYFVTANAETMTAWIMGFSDYSVNGTWTLLDGMTNHASKTLHTKHTPSNPWISISATTTTVTLGADMETNSTAILYSSPRIPPIWKVEGVMNAGDLITFPQIGNQGYFKLISQ